MEKNAKGELRIGRRFGAFCGLKKGLSHPEGKFVAGYGISLQKPAKPHEPE
jgi:hypothetical protein